MTSYIRLTVDIAGPGGLGAGLRVGELALVAIVARPDRGVVAANGPFFHADLPNTPSPSKIIIIYMCVYISDRNRDQQKPQIISNCRVTSQTHHLR